MTESLIVNTTVTVDVLAELTSLMVMCPVYIPGFRPAGSAEKSRNAGVDGVAEPRPEPFNCSQLPSSVLAAALN